MLEWKWSPQQIVAALRRTYPNNSAYCVSYKIICIVLYVLFLFLKNFNITYIVNIKLGWPES